MVLKGMFHLYGIATDKLSCQKYIHHISDLLYSLLMYTGSSTNIYILSYYEA